MHKKIYYRNFQKMMRLLFGVQAESSVGEDKLISGIVWEKNNNIEWEGDMGKL